MPYGITTPAWVFALESATDKWLDGRIAEPTLFIGDIGDDGFAALAAGVAPHEVAEPVLRYSLLGSDLRCPWSGITATIAGSVPAADHPSGVQAGISVPQRWGNIIAAPVVLPWDPTNYGVPIWWLDAAVGVEEAPANPCEDGDDVMNWLDLSATGMDYDQLVPPNTPTWHVNVVNGLPVVRFDGANSFMNPAGPENFGAFTELTGFIVCKRNIGAHGPDFFHWFSDPPGTNDRHFSLRVFGVASDTLGFDVFTDAGSVTVGCNCDLSNFSVVSFRVKQNGTAKIWVNNIPGQELPVGLLKGIVTVSVLGDVPAGTAKLNGDIGQIVYFGTEFPDITITAATASLMTYYGI